MSEQFSIDEVKNFFTPANLKEFFQFYNLKEFAGRAWNGELPLWQAFWGLTIATNIAVNIAIKILSFVGHFAIVQTIIGILALIVTLPLSALQLVSVWRSAMKYNAANPGIYWGYAAQALVVLGGLAFVSTLLSLAMPHH